MSGKPGSPATRSRWLARASLAAAAASAVTLLAAAGTDGARLLALVAAEVVVVVIGLWVAVSHRGLLRWTGLLVSLTAVVVAFVAEARNGLLWVVIVCSGLFVVAVLAGNVALRPAATKREAEMVAARPLRPFLIMNPRSGGGKVARFDLRERAEQLGAEVTLLDGPVMVDVAQVARQAVADGADLLGVAGGDGTQALVAGVAAASGVPLLVIPAG